MFRFLWPMALLSLLLVAGCAPDQNIVGGRVPDRIYRTVASLSPGTTEIVASHALVMRLVGRTAACNFPTHAIESIPVVAGVKPDYEKLTEIKPDLIVYDTDLYNESDLAKLRDLGIDLFEVKGDTIDEYVESITLLASLTAAETAMSTYIDRIHGARAQAQGDPVQPTPRVAILMPGGGTEHMIAGVGSFQADLVRAAGGEPVGPDGNRFERLNAEQILARNPQIIIVAGSADELVKDPRLAPLEAMRTGRVFEAPQDELLRRGSRVNTIITRLYRAFSSAGRE
jgi:iron complex transport system substrate-binding protein